MSKASRPKNDAEAAASAPTAQARAAASDADATDTAARNTAAVPHADNAAPVIAPLADPAGNKAENTAGSAFNATGAADAADAASSAKDTNHMKNTTGAISPAPTAPASAPQVFVFANLPHGQRFALPGGREVRLEGWPVSRLRGPDGGLLPGGGYGVTPVDAALWTQVLRLYGSMTVFRSGLIFDAPTKERGEAMTRERAALRHGLEPVDIRTTNTTPGTAE